MAEITGVLLAAGFSARFGANKLLEEIDGHALIADSAAALSPCDRVIAVVRADDQVLQSELYSIGVDYVVNPQPGRGMGFSIACGVNATAQSKGWCLLPADMPYVMAATTALLVDALHAGAAMAAPFYQGRRGHPVAFSHSYVDALCVLDGDNGARSILEQNMAQLTSVITDDAGVLVDIDTALDLERIVKNEKF